MQNKSNRLIINCDGGSRGNPGPAACAFVVSLQNKIIYQDSKYLGRTTNNVAEYSAVILALFWLKQNLTDEKVVFVLDSELVVKQITGVYKVKNTNLKKLVLEVKDLLASINTSVTFTHVLRDHNIRADELVNTTLDANS